MDLSEIINHPLGVTAIGGIIGGVVLSILGFVAQPVLRWINRLLKVQVPLWLSFLLNCVICVIFVSAFLHVYSKGWEARLASFEQRAEQWQKDIGGTVAVRFVGLDSAVDTTEILFKKGDPETALVLLVSELQKMFPDNQKLTKLAGEIRNAPADPTPPQPQISVSPNSPKKEDFFGLGDFGGWLIEDKEKQTARGAVIYNLNKDFKPKAGWVIHTVRVPGGSKGDTIAKKGEVMSLYIPSGSAPFSIK
ncbi:hypothetical protein FACS1894187_23800 [Synergistales bacterium]|nr:hypothetical protein FACS1894187_23800 [Synergistales bacterium]